MYILPAIAFMTPAVAGAEPIDPALTDFTGGALISAGDVNANFDRIEVAVDDNAADIDANTTRSLQNQTDIANGGGGGVAGATAAQAADIDANTTRSGANDTRSRANETRSLQNQTDIANGGGGGGAGTASNTTFAPVTGNAATDVQAAVVSNTNALIETATAVGNFGSQTSINTGNITSNDLDIATNANNIGVNDGRIAALSAPTPAVDSYDAVLVLDNARTAAADWAAFFKPYVAWGSGSAGNADGSGYTEAANGRGQVNVSVIYKLTRDSLLGDQALVPERDCYDGMGAAADRWAYKACFFLHYVRNSDTDFVSGPSDLNPGQTAIFTDSIGQFSFNAPFQQGWNGMKVTINHSGRIDIDQDLNNNYSSSTATTGVESTQKDTIIWEFGNGWNTGHLYNQPAVANPAGDTFNNLPGQPGIRAGTLEVNNQAWKVTDAAAYNSCAPGGTRGSFNVICTWNSTDSSWVYLQAGRSFDSETTRAGLPIPGPANGSDWLVTDGRHPHDCAPTVAGDGVVTLAAGGHEVLCVWSGDTEQWYPAHYGTGYRVPSGGFNPFINRGHVMVEMIGPNIGQTVINTGGRGLPNMSPQDRVRADSNGGILIVGYNDSSYVNSREWTIIANGLDLDDIAFQNISSWGSVMPRFTTVGWAYSGLGAWIMGNPNVSETQSAGFKGMTHGWLFGDPVYGDASPKWEKCTASGIRGATDISPSVSFRTTPFDPPNDDSGDEGTCVGIATTPRGLMIDASMSEGTAFSTIVSTVPMSRMRFSGFYAEASGLMKGYPIAMGPWMCDGISGTTPLPKNTVAQNPGQCADVGTGGAGTRAPYASAERTGIVRFDALVFGQGKSANGPASGPILFGPNSGGGPYTAGQKYSLDGVGTVSEDRGTVPNQQFIVSDSILLSGGPQVYIKTPWPFYETEYGQTSSLYGDTRYNVSEYYNVHHVDDRNVSKLSEAIQWSSITSADEVAIAAQNHRYYESIECVARATSAEVAANFTPNVTINVFHCDHNATNCVDLASGVTVSALSSAQETVLTTPVRIDQGDYLLIDPTVANGASPTNFSCSVRWHR
jgi:hypothetical protein